MNCSPEVAKLLKLDLAELTNSTPFKPSEVSPEVCLDDDLFSVNTGGIAGTAVTFKDLEEAARRQFGPNININKDAEVVVLSGVGLNSRVALFRNIWTNPSLYHPSTLATLLNKTAGSDKTSRDRQVAMIKNYYDVEIEVYDLLRKTSCSGFLKCLLAQNFTAFSQKAFLVLEFVENARTLNDWEAVSEKNMKAILKDLCQLHSLKVSRHRKFDFNKNALWKSRTGRLGLKKIQPFIGTIGNFMESRGFMVKLLVLTSILETRIYDIFAMAKEIGLPEVFCHNDLWNYNILMQEDSYRAIIDFQACHHSYIGLEFGRFFSHFLHNFYKIDEFLNFYTEEMLKFPENTKIARKNVKQSWNLFFPFHFWGTATSLTIRGDKMCSNAKEPKNAAEIIRRKVILLVDLALEGLEKIFPSEM